VTAATRARAGSAPQRFRQPTSASGLRSDIQALRAAAVLAVVVNHLWPGWLPGGFLGVDVFFAISGFLITAHLIRELDGTGTLRLGRFWLRRVRRLIPASVVVLAVVAIAVWLWVSLRR
jgi:peptidoglycan/LPS O-acetylase OafA/YrhL